MHPIALALLLAAPSAGSDAEARELYEQLAVRVAAAYDSARGGFVTRKGVPVESAVELAMTRAGEDRDGAWSGRAAFTLAWTRGLLDTMGGGFAYDRRGDGADALSKRADANARRLELWLRAWQATGNEAYRRDAGRLVDWFERVLLDGRGGFVSAQVGDRELEPDANGEAIHAWLTWAVTTRDVRRRDFALLSLDRVWETCWVARLGLLRKNSFGDVIHEPLLVDQVEMGRALVLGARLCGRAADRERAVILGDLVVERFEDTGRGLRTQSVPGRHGSIHKAPKIAAENARAARFLAELAALTGDSRYREAARRTLAAFRKDFEKMGLEAGDWALAARACFAADLPDPPDWVAEAREGQEPPRKRSVRIKLGKY